MINKHALKDSTTVLEIQQGACYSCSETKKVTLFTPPALSTGVYNGKSCHVFCKRLAAMLSEKRDSHTAK